MPLGIDFGANLALFWLYFPTPGVSWGVLEASWGRLGRILEHLGASWWLSVVLCGSAYLSLAYFGSNKRPSWAVLGPSWPRSSLSGFLKNLKIPVVFHCFSIFLQFCIFTPLGCILTHLKGVLGRFLAVLGPSWHRLGPFWRRLGASWVAFWPPKTLPRSLQEAFKTPPGTS